MVKNMSLIILSVDKNLNIRGMKYSWWLLKVFPIIFMATHDALCELNKLSYQDTSKRK